MSAGESISSLRKGVGSRSRVAGISFAGLTVVLLVLSLRVESIVLQVDSVVSFLVAVILLFTDPRKRVRTPVLAAVLQSSDEAISTLSANAGPSYVYVPGGEGAADVFVRPQLQGAGGLPDGDAARPDAVSVVPPGRGMAELFMRETGARQAALWILKVSIPEVMAETFGLADSVRVDITADRAVVVLENPSVWCTCDTLPPKQGGYLGCAVASCLAVLFCLATKREVMLERCAHDLGAGTWTVSMSSSSSSRPPS